MGKAQSEAGLTPEIFITQWVSGDTANNKAILLHKQKPNLNCPQYNLPDKDTSHVLTYQPDGICSLRLYIIVELRVWSNPVDTHPDVIPFLCSRL